MGEKKASTKVGKTPSLITWEAMSATAAGFCVVGCMLHFILSLTLLPGTVIAWQQVGGD